MNLISDKEPFAAEPRSTHWPAVRAAHLAKEPRCALCDGDRHLNVHHVIPFHLRPDLELDAGNLITLCENKAEGVNCHLLFGHLGSFHSFNPNVRKDVKEWRAKLEKRP